jgi:hypothetical protein
MSRRARTPRRSSRVCDVCHRPYHRRNLVEGWTTQNIGHRAGWTKEISRVCVGCCNAKRAQRVLVVAQLVPVSERTPGRRTG